MLQAMRKAFGEQGLQRLISERTKAQRERYLARIPEGPLARRVEALAALRAEEGYMAEWKREDAAFLLVENHCPICEAARVCQGLCAGELDLFRDVLGPEARVERTEHVLEGARRCVYRIEPLG